MSFAFVIISITVISNLCSNYYFLHFIEEETKAERIALVTEKVAELKLRLFQVKAGTFNYPSVSQDCGLRRSIFPAVFVQYIMCYLTIILQHVMNMVGSGGQKGLFINVCQSLNFTKMKTLYFVELCNLKMLSHPLTF